MYTSWTCVSSVMSLHFHDASELYRNPGISWAKYQRAAHAPVTRPATKIAEDLIKMTQCWGNELLINKGLSMGLCFPRLEGSLSSPRVRGSKSLLPLSPAAPHRLQHFLLLDPEDKEEKMNFVSLAPLPTCQPLHTGWSLWVLLQQNRNE